MFDKLILRKKADIQHVRFIPDQHTTYSATALTIFEEMLIHLSNYSQFMEILNGKSKSVPCYKKQQ